MLSQIGITDLMVVGDELQPQQRACRLVSMRACEMEAKVWVSQRERGLPVDSVAKELQQVQAEKSSQGVTVTGKVE